MSKELFFIGAPVQFKPGVNIYPPKVKEVVSNPGYNSFSRVLTYSHEEIEDIYVKEISWRPFNGGLTKKEDEKPSVKRVSCFASYENCNCFYSNDCSMGNSYFIIRSRRFDYRTATSNCNIYVCDIDVDL